MTEVEIIFFKVLEDLKDYLDDLTLVGGWLPYVYARYLWNDLAVRPIIIYSLHDDYANLKFPHFRGL